MISFNEWMNLCEGMSIYVKDHDYGSQVVNIEDIASQLKRFVFYPIWNSIPPEEQAAVKKGGSGTHDTISPDGSFYTDGTQVLNVYTAGWSPQSIQKMIQGIKYYLDEMKVKYGQFKNEKSQMFKTDVIRIPILQFRKTQNPPPEMHLSNATARMIFQDILGINDDGDGSSYEISAADLLMKIGTAQSTAFLHTQEPEVSQEPGHAMMISGGMDEEGLKHRLNILEKIAQWAISNGYTTIYAV